MNFIFGYLFFGLGFYIGLALNNPKSFRNVHLASIIRGLVFAIILWPISLITYPLWSKK